VCWQRYLMQFGYLSLSDMETQQVRSLEEVRAAVRRLQRQAGLPQTGAFDSATERLMKTRRCGVQDLSAPALARSAGPESFTLNSGQWPHTAITYRYIALFTPSRTNCYLAVSPCCMAGPHASDQDRASH